jgi:hypothetical protein
VTERRLEEFGNDALPRSKRFKMIFLTIINGRTVLVKMKTKNRNDRCPERNCI